MSPRKSYDTPPHGLAELEKRYGRILLDKDPAGGYRIISPIGWETQWMVSAKNLPGNFIGGQKDKKLYVHRDMEQPLRRALTRAAIACPDYVIKTIGCWAKRYKRTNRGEVSVHTYALAIDINADTNPLTDASELITDMPDAFVRAFDAEGFMWGGDWGGNGRGHKDPMHYQWVTGGY